MEVTKRDLSSAYQFKRIAVHHILLPPNTRSSIPHAESAEEEFFYVIKGKPDLWINGYIYPLDVGLAVGFPAGTGISHTVLNNTNESIELLVVGEKSKPENKYVYPIHPDLKDQHLDHWWHEAPDKKMGPHDGRPHPVQKNELGQIQLPIIYDCKNMSPRKSFHYTGDNETFGVGFRLTDHLGLKSLGISFDLLPPHIRSSFPHAHTHEEEFAFILSGEVSAWLHGELKKVKTNDSIGFTPNTGIAHCLINHTDLPMTYLAIGETREFLHEKIYYPLNQLRNIECQRKGFLWTNPPPLKLKGGSAHPPKSFPENIKFRKCKDSDAADVLRIFLNSIEYFQKVEGKKPTVKTALHAILDAPKNIQQDYFKDFLLIDYLGKSIGTIELHAHHPASEYCYIGLFLLIDQYAVKGLGRKCYDLCEDYIRRSYGCKKIKLGVHQDNDVAGFWEKMGFQANGHSYNWVGEGKIAKVTEYEKIIARE